MTPGERADDDLERTLERLRLLCDAERFAEGEPLWRAALATSPDDARLLVLGAVVLLGLERPGEAADLAAHAAYLMPGSDVPQGLLAQALLDLGRREEACFAAQRAVQLDPHDWANLVRYSRCLATMPEFVDQAWEVARQAVRMAPEQPWAHANIADLAVPDDPRFADEQALDVAERALREALRLDPADAALHNNLARVLSLRSRPLDALTGFATTVHTDPSRRASLGVDNARIVLEDIVVRLAGVVLVGAIPVVVGMGRVVAGLTAVLVLGYAAWLARGVARLGREPRTVVTAAVRSSLLLRVGLVLAVLGIGLLVGAAIPSPVDPRTGAAGAWLAALGSWAVVWLPRSVRR